MKSRKNSDLKKDDKKVKEAVDALFEISEIVGPIMEEKERNLKDKLKKYYARKSEETCSGY